MTDSAAPARNAGVARKVQKLLDVDSNEQMRAVLQHTEAACPALLADGALDNLRGTKLSHAITAPLNQRVVAMHDAFLARLGAMRDVFRTVAGEVTALDEQCAQMHAAASEAADRSAALLAAVTVFREEERQMRAREQQVKDLMAQYRITPAETDALESGPISEEFLRVLYKVRGIHSSCRELVVAEHQQAVIEIMERMYLLQVRAVERLSQYLCATCADTMTHDMPELSDFFVKCVAVTADRPAQFTRIVSEVSKARRTAIIRRFYDLVANGSGKAQALDASATDPVRYVGAMLSWLHQAIAEEDDLLSCFFQKSRGAEDDAPLADTAAVGKLDLLDQIFEPICKHFQSRLDQVTDRCLRQAETAAGATATRGAAALPHVMVVMFKLEGMLTFYAETTATLLGKASALATTIEAAKLDTLRIFFDLLKAASTRMVAGRRIPKELGPTPEMEDMLGTLRMMLETVAESLVPHSKREAEIAPVLGAVIDPLESLTGKGALFQRADQNTAGASASPGAKAGTGPSAEEPHEAAASRLVFRINVLGRVAQLLEPYPFAAARHARLLALLEADRAALVAASTALVFEKTAIDRAEAVLSAPRNAPLTGPELVAAFSGIHRFLVYVLRVGSLVPAAVELLQNARTRQGIVLEVTTAGCAAYRRVFDLVSVADDSAFRTDQSALQALRAAADDAEPRVLAALQAVIDHEGANAQTVLTAAASSNPDQVELLLDVAK